MKINNIRFIVLIPHRDALKSIIDYKQKLFQKGFIGSYSFPTVIPLMITQKPYTLAELKETAFLIRKMSLKKDTDEKFISQKPEIIEILPKIMLGGFSFDILIDGFLLKENSATLPRFVLGFSLLKYDTEEDFFRLIKENPPLPISFRACSVANMVFTIENDHTFSWEIGHPVWLPAIHNTQYTEEK
jgi:hypothetical protein